MSTIAISEIVKDTKSVKLPINCAIVRKLPRYLRNNLNTRPTTNYKPNIDKEEWSKKWLWKKKFTHTILMNSDFSLSEIS